MPSIKFDNTEILDTTHYPQFLKHESFPERFLNIADLSKDNGSVLISNKFGAKKIQVRGVLVGTSQADLESKIDIFKELFARVGKNLDMDWNGTTRRYIATCSSFVVDRDHYHITWVPWSAEFTVPSGIAEDSTETTLQDFTEFNLGRGTFSLTFAGSAPPKPKFTIKNLHASATTYGISLINNDNGQRMFIPMLGGIVANVQVEIDCRLKTVKSLYYGSYTGTMRYYGQFPEFVPGVNSVSVEVGDIKDQEFNPTVYNLNQPVYGSLRVAQKLTDSDTDITNRAVSMKLFKIGTIGSGYMNVEIQTDTNGAPSGTAVSHAVFRLNMTDVLDTVPPTEEELFVKIYTYDNLCFTLNADAPYWLVIKGNSIGDASNYIVWSGDNGLNAQYKRGCAATYNGSWTILPDQDQIFRLYRGGVINNASPSDSLRVKYYKRYL